MSQLEKEKEAMLISELFKGNLIQLYTFLRNFNFNPVLLRDIKNNNAIHISCLNNNSALVEFLIRYVEEYYPKISIENWVNEKNNDGITSLHFAVFRGNFSLFELLRKNGGDVNVVSKLGLSSMHVAAQGDQMRILAFLKGFGMSFVGKDYKGATPLHWAAYLGCEMAASVLISWKAEINCRDSHGYTPLHLAAIAGNPRITRILMLKGANQNISDYKGRTPLDFAMEFGFTHIISLLSKPSFLSLCGIKPPQRPIHCKRLLMYLYISLLSLSISTNLFILHINSYDYLILSSLQVIFFIIIANKNPGYIEKNGKSLLELCEEYESSHICPDCIVRRLPRSRHCQSCEKCIEKFDHHCPWINTCIGAQNLGIFYCFILATFALLISSGYHDLMFLINFYNLQETFQLNIEICIAAVWTFIATGFFFPLLLLLLVQTRNFLSNTTTNERFSRNPGMPAERNDSDSNVNRENTCKNVLEMCCNLNPAIEKPNNRVMENNSLKFTMIASDYEESLSYSNSS